ncbi:DDE-type integrase/transposase/recombinase [Duganella levis]|uniref:DDE-type integrase/transposase/recombinase n=1 Tax=Duganella levis TaxID=2692169 RepID=A0ABW9VZ89_9BURK|nr:DDE-type integrase/transposase/recombinase [Duganella levis]MYN26950.1 DDE-type integrase/transposase/recombinase [Duganella levis]
MEGLSHNQTFQIEDGDLAGIYRVVVNDIAGRLAGVVRLDAHIGSSDNDLETSESAGPTMRRRGLTLTGKLQWFEHSELAELKRLGLLSTIELARENFEDSPTDDAILERRKNMMARFLHFDTLMRTIRETGSIAPLVSDTLREHGGSKSNVYKLWALLCRFGFSADSLRSRMDRCGAPGVHRHCSVGGRQKNGRKTNAERVAIRTGEPIPRPQPGMTEEWRQLILIEDSKIPSPKPQFIKRFDDIMKGFRRYFRDDGNTLTPRPLEMGEYPNQDQVRRVLTVDIPVLERIRQKTTAGHYALHHRPLKNTNWKGVSGPGHTWAIDSTIADMYLRSSINRAWHIGRPIVYVMVDVWSTAVVGFYVCLRGPSWEMAKVAIFNATADSRLFGDLWKFAPVESLYPRPAMPAIILSDRGEYLSYAAKETAFDLIDNLSIAAPYRPDWKGCVEVIHRIEKDHQFWVPGAIDARRKEYELRKFDPRKAIFTIAEYTHYLYNVFRKYNLTADRRHRLDTHMIAEDIPATPAGLWRWGHEIGIGTERKFDREKLIEKLLVPGQATVRRNGIFFNNLAYESELVSTSKWLGEARNVGRWSVDCHHYPGSVSRIWIPDTIKGAGRLELTLSQQTTASADQTFEEVEDARMYQSLKRRDEKHNAMQTRMEVNDENEALVAKARAATAAACKDQMRDKPSQSEARSMETEMAKDEATVSPPLAESQTHQSNHVQIRKAVLAAKQNERRAS